MPSKKTLSSKCWLILFAATVFAMAAVIAVFNFCVDPFGAFGDRFLQWWSYDASMNPRVSKISFLDQHHDQYDSYAVGPSSISGFPIEALNKYFDASFYSPVVYGTDMKDVELTSKYLVENYTVKNLVVNLFIRAATQYDTEPNPLTYNLHYKVDGSSALEFYKKYLFADPRISITKLQRYLDPPYLVKNYCRFSEETGAYDRRDKDLEAVGDLESYLSRSGYKEFNNYPAEPSSELRYLDECMESVRAIKKLCDENGINLLVLCPPLYYEMAGNYAPEDQARFRKALAEVTGYWDFTLSRYSYDPRSFYDTTHFRHFIGEMALAKIFGDTSVYYPEDLGEYVPQGSDPGPYQGAPVDESEYTAQVPILMYQNLADEGQGEDTMSLARFTEHMAALTEAGYTAVTFEDLKAYVEHKADLPEKPVVITFDGGYSGSLELGMPVLEEYGMKATAFAAGISMGKSQYKETGQSTPPHFSKEQAQAANDSGVISVQSQSYDLCQVSGLDEEPIRYGVKRVPDETEHEYAAFIQEDCRAMADALGYTPWIFAYPYGEYGKLSERVLSEMGIEVTLTLSEKTNTIIRGMPQSLRQLGRYSMQESITGDDLLELLEGQEE